MTVSQRYTVAFAVAIVLGLPHAINVASAEEAKNKAKALSAAKPVKASEIIAGQVKKKAKPVETKSKPKRVARRSCRGSSGLGVHRTVVVDGAKGQQFGSVQFKDELLREKEVILTFDDGPLAKYTRAILSALDRHCTKATFFAVGRMAMAFPNVLREVADAGHTVAGHTWSHPKLGRLSQARGTRDLEQGFSAVRSAVGRPIAPFFRFPYLDSPKWMQEYLKKRNVAVFSIDIDSGDTRGYSVSRIVRKTMRDLKRRKKGILLFHDIKSRTAAAIPKILRKLHEGGYKVVHVVGKEPLQTQKKYDELFEKKLLAKKKSRSGRDNKSNPTPVKTRAKPKRKSWPNDAENPFDSASKRTKARQRRAALRKRRAARRAAARRAGKRQKQKQQRNRVAKTTSAFTFEWVFGQ